MRYFINVLRDLFIYFSEREHVPGWGGAEGEGESEPQGAECGTLHGASCHSPANDDLS